MGYTTVSTSVFDPNMPQTPENVRKVLDIAGFTAREAARDLDVHPEMIIEAIAGLRALTDYTWRRLLDVCGKRSFDHDSGSE